MFLYPVMSVVSAIAVSVMSVVCAISLAASGAEETDKYFVDEMPLHVVEHAMENDTIRYLLAWELKRNHETVAEKADDRNGNIVDELPLIGSEKAKENDTIVVDEAPINEARQAKESETIVISTENNTTITEEAPLNDARYNEENETIVKATETETSIKGVAPFNAAEEAPKSDRYSMEGMPLHAAENAIQGDIVILEEVHLDAANKPKDSDTIVGEELPLFVEENEARDLIVVEETPLFVEETKNTGTIVRDDFSLKSAKEVKERDRDIVNRLPFSATKKAKESDTIQGEDNSLPVEEVDEIDSIVGEEIPPLVDKVEESDSIVGKQIPPLVKKVEEAEESDSIVGEKRPSLVEESEESDLIVGEQIPPLVEKVEEVGESDLYVGEYNSPHVKKAEVRDLIIKEGVPLNAGKNGKQSGTMVEDKTSLLVEEAEDTGMVIEEELPLNEPERAEESDSMILDEVILDAAEEAEDSSWIIDIVEEIPLDAGEGEEIDKTQAVTESSNTAVVVKSGLETGMMTASIGFVQTPGFDSGGLYPQLMDSLVQINVPLHHVTMVSVLRQELRAATEDCTYFGNDKLRLYNRDTSHRSLLWTACGSHVPQAEVYDARLLHVTFVSTRFLVASRADGMKLLFSFHQKSRAPSRGDSGKWNCSGPVWPEMERHFRCDLVGECEGGEDEAPCDYTGHCGQGRLTLQDRCYLYVENQHTTWRRANTECRRHGGYLASLNTPQEWAQVAAALRLRRGPVPVFVGLQYTPSVFPLMYKNTAMWADTSMAYYAKVEIMPGAFCGQMTHAHTYINLAMMCDSDTANYLCELSSSPTGSTSQQAINPNVNEAENKTLHNGMATVLTESDTRRDHYASASVDADANTIRDKRIKFPSPPRNTPVPVPSVVCRDGHVTHTFLACDPETACWASSRRISGGLTRDVGEDEQEGEGAWDIPSRASCPAPMTSLPPMMTCASGGQRVPYSLVCDHRRQCADGSDEDFCVFPPCPPSTPLQCATSSQCIPLAARCDGLGDCVDGTDEAGCQLRGALDGKPQHLPPPAVVEMTPVAVTDNEKHPYIVKALSDASLGCPRTHFQCPGDGYCLPVFMRCNGVNDCPGREDEDEAACGAVSCPRLYRCRASRVCLHPSHVCDGHPQCPQFDDEVYCRPVCPADCSCQGLAVFCPTPFPSHLLPQGVRYLDASQSGLTPRLVRNQTLLIHLSVARCGLNTSDLANLTFANLHSLDLGGNRVGSLSSEDLRGMPNLQRLSVADNPLTSLFSPASPGLQLSAVRHLDLSGVEMDTFNTSVLAPFPRLRVLNLSRCGVVEVLGGGLHTVTQIRVLDVTGCPMTHFPRDMLTSLKGLQRVDADNFKLCCPATLPPGINTKHCTAPKDEVSSCDSLLRSDIYRVFLSIFSALALLGNLGCFLTRAFCLTSATKSGFSVFVFHLSLSDFLMGVYLALVGVADRVYSGSYLWEDHGWRHSAGCRVAGFLSLCANEVSACLICLITLDRFLVLRFPFSRLRFQARSAHAACLAVWVAFAVLAAVPLLPATAHWTFYSKTGICIPLPVTRGRYPGRHFAFGVFIVFNFVLFLLIAAGQVSIHAAIRGHSAPTIAASAGVRKNRDVTIARRLITVAVTDFCCWFPIGILGLLAAAGVPIPGEVNVGAAILVLPLNSAVNPFLYTVNVIMERRRRARDEALIKQLTQHMDKEC